MIHQILCWISLTDAETLIVFTGTRLWQAVVSFYLKLNAVNCNTCCNLFIHQVHLHMSVIICIMLWYCLFISVIISIMLWYCIFAGHNIFLLQFIWINPNPVIFRWLKFTLKPPYKSRMEISYWLFGTLPIGLLLSNFDSRQLMTSPRTLLGQFWHMSIFGHSRTVRVICQKKMPSENWFFLDEGARRLWRGLGF